MRILITNDDGISAPGLTVLSEIATQLAGPDGEVWTVAPATEQSGVGHCISYLSPMMVERRGDRTFAIHGSPADCVLGGLFHAMWDNKPDLILSGVNKGNNSAENTLYSGTVGACIEAALHGYKSIALSQFYGPENLTLDDTFEASRHHGLSVIRNILAADVWPTANGYGTFYNVNFPPTSAANVKGTKVAAQGFREKTEFKLAEYTAHNSRKFLFVQGGPQAEPTAPGTDVHANVAGYTSVTPMRVDLTDRDAMAQLQQAFD